MHPKRLSNFWGALNIRSSFLASNKQIASHFNADGTVKGFAEINNNERNSYNSSAYSASLQEMESELAYKPIDVNKTAGIRRVTEEGPKKTAKENWESVKQKTAEGWLASG